MAKLEKMEETVNTEEVKLDHDISLVDKLQTLLAEDVPVEVQDTAIKAAIDILEKYKRIEERELQKKIKKEERAIEKANREMARAEARAQKETHKKEQLFNALTQASERLANLKK